MNETPQDTAPQTAQDTAITTVHVVFKTHLDLGYTELAQVVARGYFEDFIPRAAQVARELREAGGEERFVWTTGSWLVHEFLARAKPADRDWMEQAIEAGDIAWHALPCTLHSELLDASLFEHGLSLSAELDRRFGRRTTAAKMTDVPGHTRGIVPLLAAAGVRFLHIGVNPASTPPEVPSAFLWRTPETVGGEPAEPADIAVLYSAADYGSALTVPGLEHALLVEHTGDNQGPPTVASVRETYARARELFPGARIVASTLDAYGRELDAVRGTLPVVTGELGDAWIHGVGSDPLKVARFRELSRLRREWLAGRGAAAGIADLADEPGFRAASTELLLVAEHTWGIAQSRHLRDYEHYAAERFGPLRATPAFAKVEESWGEQRAYVDRAVESLPIELENEADERLADVQPIDWDSPDSPDSGDETVLVLESGPVRATATFTATDGSGERPDADPAASYERGGTRLSYDPATGAVSRLEIGGRVLADADHPLALLGYQTLGPEDYERFWRSFIRSRPEIDGWAREDFMKPGIESEGAESRWWEPSLRGFQAYDDGDGDEPDGDGPRTVTVATLALPAEASERFGAPRRITLETTIAADGSVGFTLEWFDKPVCRLPEAIWLSYRPIVPDPNLWLLDKLGSWISPLEVVPRGNATLHAVGVGARCPLGDGAELWLETLDAPLIAPGRPALLHFDEGLPDLAGGMHVNLYNNAWGNNFTTWYDDPGRFRFRIGVR